MYVRSSFHVLYGSNAALKRAIKRDHHRAPGYKPSPHNRAPTPTVCPAHHLCGNGELSHSLAHVHGKLREGNANRQARIRRWMHRSLACNYNNSSESGITSTINAKCDIVSRSWAKVLMIGFDITSRVKLYLWTTSLSCMIDRMYTGDSYTLQSFKITLPSYSFQTNDQSIASLCDTTNKTGWTGNWKTEQLF